MYEFRKFSSFWICLRSKLSEIRSISYSALSNGQSKLHTPAQGNEMGCILQNYQRDNLFDLLGGIDTSLKWSSYSGFCFSNSLYKSGPALSASEDNYYGEKVNDIFPMYFANLFTNRSECLLKHPINLDSLHRDFCLKTGLISNHTVSQPLIKTSKAQHYCLKTNTEHKSVEKYSSGTISDSDQKAKPDSKDEDRKEPTGEQLQRIMQYYVDYTLPNFHKFGDPLRKEVHHLEIVFESYLTNKPVLTRGWVRYSLQMMKIRCYCSFMYPGFRMETKGSTISVKEGFVKIHWRAVVTSNTRLLGLIKDLFTFSLGRRERASFIDGISTLYVDKDGKIIKHRIERTIPLKDARTNKTKTITLKTAEAIGLASKSTYKKEDMSKS